eukprot:gene9387-9551_t
MLRIAAYKALSRTLTQIEYAGIITSTEFASVLANSASGTVVVQPVVQHHLTAAHQAVTQKAWPVGSLSLQAVRSYSQCDCPTLGGPQPDVVIVEYDEEEVDRWAVGVDPLTTA